MYELSKNFKTFFLIFGICSAQIEFYFFFMAITRLSCRLDHYIHMIPKHTITNLFHPFETQTAFVSKI